jgi:hypothetical protein
MPPRRTKLNSQNGGSRYACFAGLRLPFLLSSECGESREGEYAQLKKRPLAHQRPKSREETPKEGGGNANALPHDGYLAPRRTKCKGRIINC